MLVSVVEFALAELVYFVLIVVFVVVIAVESFGTEFGQLVAG